MDVVPRRPSVKTDLRGQPIAEGEEAKVKLPSISTQPHLSPTDVSRRSSKEINTTSRRSSNFSLGGVLGRRGSQVRRPSIRRNGDDERSQQLFSVVPLPQAPRFSSTMSLEAQFSILKGYEDRLRRQLCNVYPDYSGLLQRSQTPINGRVLLKEDDDGASLLGEDMVDGAATVRSLPVQGSRVGRPEMPQSARQERVPHHRQLLLSRRLQMAQNLLDAMADASCAVTSQPACRPSKTNLNIIQGYNWWSNGWQEEFQINEPTIMS